MRIWVVQIGEMISGVDGAVRDYRYTTLARELAAQGHEVVRWSSTFEHVSKRFRAQESVTIDLAPNLKVRLLHGLPAYQRNISLARFRQQRAIAKMFSAEASSWAAPDVIMAGVPVPELAEAAVVFGRELGIPVVVDAQDQWPDIYVTALPRAFRPLARLLLHREYRRSRRLFSGAKAITAVSETYLNWAVGRAGRRVGVLDGVYPLGFAPVEIPAVNSEQRQKLLERFRIPDGAFLALFVGTFGSSYDVETMVRCARCLEMDASAKIHILMAGDGDKMAMAREMAGDCQAITIPGWLGNKEVQQLAAISSVGLCAYSAKALQSIPYKPLEYMASGLPLLSSLDGEMRRILDDHRCGLYYRAGDLESLATQLRNVAGSRAEAAAMGRRARILFEEQYDSRRIYPSMASRILQIVRQE